jgi:hypothetical protein
MVEKVGGVVSWWRKWEVWCHGGESEVRCHDGKSGEVWSWCRK